MKDWVTTTVIWRNGLEVPVGTPLRLADAESKYLGHALSEPEAEQATAETSAAEPEEKDDKPVRRQRLKGATDGDVN